MKYEATWLPFAISADVLYPVDHHVEGLAQGVVRPIGSGAEGADVPDPEGLPEEVDGGGGVRCDPAEDRGGPLADPAERAAGKAGGVLVSANENSLSLADPGEATEQVPVHATTEVGQPCETPARARPTLPSPARR